MSSGKLPARHRDALYAVLAIVALFLMGLYMGWYP